MTAFDTTPHEFGKPLPQKASDEVLEALFNRRSAPAPTLQQPGPSPEQMDLLIRLGLRVPDHGKIGPWRIVRFTPEAKTQVVEKLKALAESRGDKKDVGALIKMSTPPDMLMVVSAPIQPHKIPLWEQQLSAAAVCQNLLIAAGAMGYGANWITDWYAYDAEARTILGVKEDENVAGFIYLGTPTEPPLERERPDYDARVSWWG
ncbi:MAG: nitroreductase family protein [Asticcacaulis sp.]|uniref:nitroreductase family protein n=1 Tax=Asticcacaulis sp. TaxID=1872648 RepID=UPI003F7B5D43